MTCGTHLTGGFLAATIQYKLTGYCDPYMVAFFAIAPDICNKESVISKSITPLSWVVNKISKIEFKGSDAKKGKVKKFFEKFLDHRYITHCWIPLVAFYLLYLATNDIKFINILLGWGIGHVFLDLFNIRGIPLFFPLCNIHIKLAYIVTGSKAEKILNLSMWIIIGIILIPTHYWIDLYYLGLQFYHWILKL